jgi:hypothetical protein
VANCGKVQKQWVAQQVPNPLVGCEVSLRQKCIPVLVAVGQLDKGAVELLAGQGKYLDRLDEPKSRWVGSQHLLVLLGSASDDHTYFSRKSLHKLVESLGEMLPEPERNLVEPIED